MSIRIACAAAAAFLGAAVAHAAPPFAREALTKDDVKAELVRIEEQYDQSQTRCRRVQGHARELCNEQARGQRDIQTAELDFRAQPNADTDQKVRLAKAEAAYSLALVRCKEFDGQARRVCRADARTTWDEAKNEAKLQKEVVAQQLQAENTVRERTVLSEKIAAAEYAAARARCEMLPGEGRDNCLADAKRRFNRD